VRGPLNRDVVGDVGLAAETPERLRAYAAQLVAWAAERHPRDAPDVTPAALLVEAGEVLDLLGDHQDALGLFQRAVAAEGETRLDARCYCIEPSSRWERRARRLARGGDPPYLTR
jgi:hypothetical protein